MLYERLRRWGAPFKKTPFHPQWLMRYGPSAEERLRSAHGVTLDIGCADRWAESLLTNRCRYVALDYPVTGRNLYQAKPDVFADAAALPFAANIFDTVLLFEVLEHVPQASKSLKEIGRVLKPGGRLLLTMPFLYPMHDEPHDYRRYTLHGLKRAIEAAGLCLESIKPDLHCAAATGLLVNLSISGMWLTALRKNRLNAILLPPLALLVLCINLFAWLSQMILPTWPAFSAGYLVVALRPGRIGDRGAHVEDHTR